MSAPGIAIQISSWIAKAEVLRVTGWTVRHLRRVAAANTVQTKQGARRGAAGETLYLASTLPEAAQLKLQATATPQQQLLLPPHAQAPLFPPPPSALEQARTVLTDPAQQKQAMERWVILQPVMEYSSNPERAAQYMALQLRNGQPVSSFSRLVVYLCEQNQLSRATLFSWRKRYLAGGIASLADSQRKDKGKSHWFEKPEHVEAKAIVAAEYLNSGRSKQAAYEALVRWYRSQGLDQDTLPHYETVRAWLESSDIPNALKILAREGESRHNERCLPYLRRAYTDIGANQILVSDHMIHDMLVRNDCFAGLPQDAQMRLRFTCWIDMRTRKVVGYSWTPEGSSRSIITAYRMAALRFGDPLQAYTDNGKDYIKATKSGAKFERGPVDEQFLKDAEWLAQGALYRIGVQVQHCIKYHPQSKHIERFFRTLHMRLDSIFPHYTTGNAYNRPDQANAAMAEHKKLLVMGRGGESSLIPASEFIRMSATWLEMDYNNAPHRGEGMDGCSPNQLFDELYPVAERRVANRAVLDTLLYERVQRRVDSCALRLNGKRYIAASSESAGALYLANETDVILCYDPNAPDAAIACDLDGNKIADLKPEQLTAHSEAAHEQIAESMEQRHKLRNAMKETERHIKRAARQLGHTTAYEDLQRRSLLPAAGDAYTAFHTTQRVGSERVQPDNHAVAPASAAEIAEATMRLIRQ